MGALAIHLLGPPRVEMDRRPAPGPRGRKAWALLAFLLLARAPTTRERLAGLLFGDADDPQATLRWNLAELRRMLGPGVDLGGDPVRLTLPPDAFVDVRTLGSGSWVEAVKVPGLGQELLEGVDAQVGAAYEAWLLAERRHLAGVSAAVLNEAATARLAAGDPNGAVELATRLIAYDEFDEESNALLLRALVASGALDEAQAYLERTVARFRRELGVEPSATLLRSIETSAREMPPTLPGVRSSAAIESLLAAGEAAVGAGVLEAGLEILGRAVADARTAVDRHLEARALVALGEAFVHGGRGRDGEGATALHAAVGIAEQIGDPALIAEACRELGYIELKGAHYERAWAWLDRAIAVAPDRDSRAAASAIRGAVASDTGRTAQAIELLAVAATDGHDLDKPRLEAWALAFLARTQLLREEWDSARASASRAVDVARGSGWMTFVAYPQSLLASVDLADGRLEEAGAAFESAFALGCQIGDPCWEGIAARGIGLVHHARGRIDEAVAWLDDARSRCIRIPSTYLWMHAYCLDALCEVAIDQALSQTPAYVQDLESVASRTGMAELLTRANLHRAALGEPGAADAARLFAERIDNPVVHRRMASLVPA